MRVPARAVLIEVNRHGGPPRMPPSRPHVIWVIIATPAAVTLTVVPFVETAMLHLSSDRSRRLLRVTLLIAVAVALLTMLIRSAAT